MMMDLVDELMRLFGSENVKFDHEEIEKYSRDETSGVEGEIPLAVVFPTSTEQVSQLMRWANERRVAVVPRGAGTGLSGGAIPTKNSVVVSLERMNRIIELDERNMTIVVEPGVITGEIQKIAEEHGLYYAGDPASSESSSIGGNVAENAGGVKVIKYGPTAFHVLGLEVVLPTGEVVHFGGKTLKNVTGYDMVRLFVGSEGTLGIVTKIVLRLVPRPKYAAVLLVPFGGIEDALLCVPKLLSQSGLLPASIEFMDRYSSEMASRFLNESIPNPEAECHLIFELESSDKQNLVKEYIELGETLMQMNATEVYIADDRTQRMKIWRFRKAIAEGIIAFRPVHCMEDVVVPTANMPKLIVSTYQIAQKRGLEVLNFGHVGDGNVHVTFLKPERMQNAVWEQALEEALEELYRTTVQLEGSLTGEHGVGLKRKKYLRMFLGEKEIELMKRLKSLFDPNNILNPGKIFPD
ncbi:FAD-binding oxidoreductase [Thermotoga caldifontis]|uniref:FAD-binding oxidoreductase n=1 Tax=Thermotoga caldifontis TaxID=1508419 RepID=UPI001E2EFFE8|nr:FAD-binding oxidoreductase [Thermotoga caldifontis]